MRGATRGGVADNVQSRDRPVSHTARDHDERDPLARFRDRFVIHDQDLVYLDGNSLGRLPRGHPRTGSPRRWPTSGGDRADPRLGPSGSTWPRRRVTLSRRRARGRRRARSCSRSTSVNLYKLARGALDARPGRRVLVTDDDNFPTDRYVLEGLAAARGSSCGWCGPT
jgi:kynureninase